jgi:hypothetical protein
MLNEPHEGDFFAGAGGVPYTGPIKVVLITWEMTLPLMCCPSLARDPIGDIIFAKFCVIFKKLIALNPLPMV